jgi:hypothetical protein
VAAAQNARVRRSNDTIGYRQAGHLELQLLLQLLHLQLELLADELLLVLRMQTQALRGRSSAFFEAGAIALTG